MFSLARQPSRFSDTVNRYLSLQLLRSRSSINLYRPISSTTFYKKEKPSAEVLLRGDALHEGSFSRTDKNVSFSKPSEDNMPPSTPMQFRGGLHSRPTLASFSLEGRVGVVTGGARGLGLVMAQALFISGADVALVDLNSRKWTRNFRHCTYLR